MLQLPRLLIHLIFRLGEIFLFYFGEWIQWVKLDSLVTFRFTGWIVQLIRGFGRSVSGSLSPFEVSGGESW